MERCPKCDHITVVFNRGKHIYRCIRPGCYWESESYEREKIKSRGRKVLSEYHKSIIPEEFQKEWEEVIGL